MKDFLKKYHNKKIIANSGTILASLVLAFGINEFLVDWTDMGNNLKASVINSQLQEEKSDFYLENVENKVVIKNSKLMSKVKSITTSITYNPQETQIISFNSSLWEVVELWDWEGGFKTFLIVTSWENIEINKDILEIETSKDNSSQINLINSSFKDENDEIYKLTTSWITY